LALAADTELARMLGSISRELQKIDAQVLRAEFLAIVSGSAEDVEPASAGAPAAAAPARIGGKTPNLDQFTIDITQNARSGKIDPVLGRDREIRQIVDILMRR